MNSDLLFLLGAAMLEEEAEAIRLQIADAFSLLMPSIRVRNYLTRWDLVDANQSPFLNLLHNGTDEALINVISLDRNGFNLLLEEFQNHYLVHSGPQRRGRPPKIPKSLALGMLLSHYSAPSEQKSLCVAFGVPPSTVSRVLGKAAIALEKALECLVMARIKYPCREAQADMALKVQAKYPNIEGRFCFIDGKNLRVQEPTDADRQNSMYNGCLFLYRLAALRIGHWGDCIWSGRNNHLGPP